MLCLEKYDIFSHLEKKFRKFNIKVYLVGGAVRDMLLNMDPVDLDFTAEVNEEEHTRISREIAKEWECKLEYNDFYHTAKFIHFGYEVDFIMARTESYSDIAAKPKIRPSYIIDDLRRRDFSINSMAVPLYENGNHEIIDPFSGLEDLKKGLIRVLHSQSFKDDPTRIFRGIKYASRFNFDFELDTRRYMEDSIQKGHLKYLRPGRAKSEIISVLTENNASNTVNIIRNSGIMDSLADSSVAVNSNFNEGCFQYLSDNEKFSVLLYKNDPVIIHKIADVLQLGKGFIDICMEMKNIDSLLGSNDEILYGHLFKNHLRLKDEVLNCFLMSDRRIQNYLGLKNNVISCRASVEGIKPGLRDEYISRERAKQLIRLIKGGI